MCLCKLWLPGCAPVSTHRVFVPLRGQSWHQQHAKYCTIFVRIKRYWGVPRPMFSCLRSSHRSQTTVCLIRESLLMPLVLLLPLPTLTSTCTFAKVAALSKQLSDRATASPEPTVVIPGLGLPPPSPPAFATKPRIQWLELKNQGML